MLSMSTVSTVAIDLISIFHMKIFYLLLNTWMMSDMSVSMSILLDTVVAVSQLYVCSTMQC